MLDSKVYKERCGDQSNAADLISQPFYRWTHKNYMTIMAFHWTAGARAHAQGPARIY